MGETGLLEWAVKSRRKEVDWKLPPEMPALPLSCPRLAPSPPSPAWGQTSVEELAVPPEKVEGGTGTKAQACILNPNVTLANTC